LGKIHEKLGLTRGDKTSTCRPVGQGYYGIVENQEAGQESTHLAYILEIPQAPGEVQSTFNIEKEACFFLTVLNPAQLPNATQIIPEEILSFVNKNRKWIPAIPSILLDYVGIEMVLIGETANLVKELGEAGKELENEEKEEAITVNTQQLFNELRMIRTDYPIEPLLSGKWK